MFSQEDGHDDIVMDIGFSVNKYDTFMITIAQDGYLALYSVNELKKLY